MKTGRYRAGMPRWMGAMLMLGVTLGWMGDASGLTLPESIEAQVAGAKAGQTLRLEGFDLLELKSIPQLEYSLEAGGPPLVVSDDPEYIRVAEGVALREDLTAGVNRIYVYNVNGLKEPEKAPRRISAVLENRGVEDTRYRFLRRAFPKPSGNYHRIGKDGLLGYFSSVPETEWHIICAGKAVALDPRMEEMIVGYDDLVHGLYEIELEGPARLHVVQTDPGTPGPVAALRVKDVIKSPRANAGRGVFHPSHYDVRLTEGRVLDTASGAVQLTLADGELDGWVHGHESISTGTVMLKGNYGVMYDIDMPWTSSDGRGLALVTWNHRWEGQWCRGMAAVMRTGGLAEAKGEIIEIPSDKLNTTGPPELVVVKVFAPPAAGEMGHLRWTFSPPGASCLPVPMILLPVRMGAGAVQP